MKSKYVILASALLISVIAFAQKDQIKGAEKALKNGNPQEALTILKGAETLIKTAGDSEKAHFYFVNGNAHLEIANKKVDEGQNLTMAAKSFQDLLALEKTSGKDKYSAQATASILDIKFKLLSSAIEDTKIDKNIESAQKIYEAYLLDKKDTINLYYAASTYVNGKDFSNALKMYTELKTLNYSGKGTSYLAVNKANNEQTLFNTAKERDFAVKVGTHDNPKTEVIPSKRGEIYKNIALILVQDGKIEEAKKAVSDARKANPEDNSLILTEANLYLETKDFITYKKLVAEALEKNPNDVDLVFNLGVISANAKKAAETNAVNALSDATKATKSGKVDDAKVFAKTAKDAATEADLALAEADKYYNRAIEINPNYTNAYINLAALKLEEEKTIIDEMNKLGTSTKDMKRYDVLKSKREELFKSTIPYLKKAYELNATNIDVAKTLLNVYSALEMMPESKELKAKIKELDKK